MLSNSRSFNEIFSLLKHANGSNRSELLEELKDVGHDALMEYSQQRHNEVHTYEDCVVPALAKFIKTYIPGENGDRPHRALRRSNGAFSSLKTTLRNLVRDQLASNAVHQEHYVKAAPLPPTHPIKTIRTELAQVGEREEMKEAIAAGLETKDGSLQVKGLTSTEKFSTDVKQGVYMDYFEHVLEKHDGPRKRAASAREWRRERLPQYRSLSGKPMTWNEFLAYFKKVSRRIKANVLLKMEEERINLSLLGIRIESLETKTPEAPDDTVCDRITPEERAIFADWVRSGRKAPFPKSLESAVRHLSDCPDCRSALLGQLADPYDEEHFVRDLGYLLETMERLKSSTTEKETEDDGDTTELDDSVFD